MIKNDEIRAFLKKNKRRRRQEDMSEKENVLPADLCGM